MKDKRARMVELLTRVRLLGEAMEARQRIKGADDPALAQYEAEAERAVEEMGRITGADNLPDWPKRYD